MWAYFKIELVHFFRNKKNIAIYCLFLFAVLFYSIRLAPVYDPIEKVDRDEIESRYVTRQKFLDNINEERLPYSHPAIQEAYYAYSRINPLDERRLTSLDAGDWEAYAEATSDWYEITAYYALVGDNFTFNPLYFTGNNQFAKEDAFYAYIENSVRYRELADGDVPLSVNLFEQRTALQTVERLLKDPLPLILMFACLLLTVDIVTKDRKHRSVLMGLPLADWKKVVVKFFVALIGTVGLIGPISIGVIIIGLQLGFGHLHIPVPFYEQAGIANEARLFNVMSLGQFLMNNGLLLLLWFTAIIAIVLFLSVIFRLEFFNLIVVLLFIFSEYFYRNRGVGFFWSVEKYPTTYVQTGNVIGGYQNYYYTTALIEWEKGLLQLCVITFTFLTLTVFITLHKKYKLIR